MTLDENRDYLLIKKIINYFYKKKYFFECKDIIKLVKKKNGLELIKKLPEKVIIKINYNDWDLEQ